VESINKESMAANNRRTGWHGDITNTFHHTFKWILSLGRCPTLTQMRHGVPHPSNASTNCKTPSPKMARGARLCVN
jgi:hypothetical protein